MGEVFDHQPGIQKQGPAASSFADDAVSALHNAIGKSSQEMRWPYNGCHFLMLHKRSAFLRTKVARKNVAADLCWLSWCSSLWPKSGKRWFSNLYSNGKYPSLKNTTYYCTNMYKTFSSINLISQSEIILESQSPNKNVTYDPAWRRFTCFKSTIGIHIPNLFHPPAKEQCLVPWLFWWYPLVVPIHIGSAGVGCHWPTSLAVFVAAAKSNWKINFTENSRNYEYI